MRPRKNKNNNDAYKMEIALHGHCATTPETVWPIFTYKIDEKARQSYWTQNRQEILKTWIADRPGTRPYAFWEFDSPGYRKKLSEAGPGNEELAASSSGSHWGIADWYTDPYEIGQDSPIFESQAAFLKRMALPRRRKPA